MKKFFNTKYTILNFDQLYFYKLLLHYSIISKQYFKRIIEKRKKNLITKSKTSLIKNFMVNKIMRLKCLLKNSFKHLVTSCKLQNKLKL